MIIQNIKIKKALALFFLSLLTTETLIPFRSFALTSGPSQPEHKQFAAYNANDMVDLFSGSFKYNIPLLDVDGYPVNLNYASGTGIDDEASWVGLGWNLNVGAVNRQLRGVPDDFSGDNLLTKQTLADRITYGGKGMIRAELFGSNAIKLGGGLSLGVFSDNYTGIGAEVGANAGLTLGNIAGGFMEAGLKGEVKSNTSNGVTVSGGLQLMAYTAEGQPGLSANLGYNTREGLKDLTLGATFSRRSDLAEYTYSYNTPPFTPRINFGFKNTYQEYSITLGGHAMGIFGGSGLTGYMAKQTVLSENHNNPEYGYLYADRGTNLPLAVMDFMREKENPIIPKLPNLPVPVSTPDVFSYTSQMGSGQFRLQRGNTGVVFDPTAEDQADNTTLGAEFGFGGYFHGGVNYYKQTVSNVTRKWRSGNAFLSQADYSSDSTKVQEEQAYFKLMGEQTAEDPDFVNNIQGEKVVAVSLDGRSSTKQLHDKYGNVYTPATPFKKSGRQLRGTTVSYLTAQEAARVPSKAISSYLFYGPSIPAVPPCGPQVLQTISRTDGTLRKPHHISEITVTENDGKRAVYGLPVYNTRQDEYTFAVNPAYKNAEALSKNLIQMDVDTNEEILHNYGKDNYYKHETQPPYASSYLLTAILSPDYVDVTNDGITDDDLGTAVKFNYSKVTGNFKWRSPMTPGKALYNRMLNADPTDDKGAVIYGEKELWYLNSIETKTKIAYFLTEDRDDALGVTGVAGTVNTGVKQRRLKEIRLYSKSDPIHPIKTVVLNYDYSLCPGIPNSINGGGKNTLKSLYFTYGTSKKGAHHPYVFDYKYNTGYSTLSSDRWGIFKSSANNATGGFGQLRNDEFPYTIQDSSLANSNVRQWNLTNITLPTGGTINVEYESGDYAYVQDRKAMQMMGIKALVTDSTGTATNSLRDAHGFKIAAPGPLRGANDAAILQNFVNDYLNGRNDCYAKLNVNFTDNTTSQDDGSFDNVICYGEVTKVRNNGDGTYNIIFKDVSEGSVTANPFIMAAWQRMRLEYPMYAYPGYEDRIKSATGIERALNAIVNAIGNLSELKKNFNERARDNDFCINVNLGKSFTRMVKADGIKLGGPARVRKIYMSDGWDQMSSSTAPGATYGQQYEYRTTNANGTLISSGVASYEPAIGGDENPMRMPVPYSQESRGTLTNFFYVEEPFGESLFPAPQIGYSKVIVKDLDASGNADPLKTTGWIQHEFYTARDYPVIVELQQRPDVQKRGPSGRGDFFGGTMVYELAMSQGYVIKLNDMHGKPKADRVFNQGGSEVSSTVYYYKSDPLDGDKRKLNNTVTTIDENGQIWQSETLGREIELVTDMREVENANRGTSVQSGVDVLAFGPWSIPIPHWPFRPNDDYKLLRTASVLKTVQQTGILEKVVKTVNGSTATTNNLIFDRNTGQVVVSSTNNEFNDPVFAVTLPAYWKYGKMSGAYKNANTVLKGITTDASGIVANKYAGMLTGGDELIDIRASRRCWILNSPTSSDPVSRIRLVDDQGKVYTNFSGDLKVYRSGYRNQLNAAAATVVCLKNPVDGNRLGVFSASDASAFKVIDTKAVLYEEEWGAPVCFSCPAGYVVSQDGSRCELYAVENTNDTLQVVRSTVKPDAGINGAIFQRADGTKIVKKSWFWGGDCTTPPTQTFSVAGTVTNSNAKAASVSPLSSSSSVSTCGRLNSTSVWLKNSQGVTGVWMGMEGCFNMATGGSCSLGYAADDLVKVYIDDVLRVSTPYINNSISYWGEWYVIPISLTAGKHTIRIEFYNFVIPGSSTTDNPGGIGVEVYSKSPDDLSVMADSQVPAYTAFSTLNMVSPNPAVNTYILDGNNRRVSRYPCVTGSIESLCNFPFVCDATPLSGVVNPYVLGFLGNWRVSEEKVYEVNRTDQQIFKNKGAGLNLRNSGYLTNYKPYWYFDAINLKWVAAPDSDKWVTSRYVTLYDKYGQEQENKDALLRYSSAAFGYRGAMPVAVAANAMNREIYYDGFEDYGFNSICGAGGCSMNEFDLHKFFGSDYSTYLKSDDAHSGNYSLKLTKTLELKTTVHALEHKPYDGTYLDKDALGQYRTRTTNGLYPRGFQPKPNGKYIFSAWVKDGSAGATVPNIEVRANGTLVPLDFKAIVEGWKLVEGVLDMSTIPLGANNALTLQIPASPAAVIDDIRIFPYDGNIKTYAYDDKTLRVMAEMDENNFATYYEYDDEGILIRVKKETERGIVTLKESRSVYKKMN